MAALSAESFSRDLLAADQLAAAILYIGESAEAVVLQFENPIHMIERLSDSSRRMRGSMVNDSETFKSDIRMS